MNSDWTAVTYSLQTQTKKPSVRHRRHTRSTVLLQLRDRLGRSAGSFLEQRSECPVRLEVRGRVMLPWASRGWQIPKHITPKMSSYIPSEEEKQRFMSRAIELSEEGASKGHGGPYGSVIVKEGKIVAEGYNRVFIDCDPSAHGEVVAIRNAGKHLRTFDLQGCSLYTNFEPCPMCTAAIWWSRLDGVYYAQPVEGSTKHHEENQATVFQFVVTSIDKRSIPGEQVESKAKDAMDVIKNYLNDDTKKV